MILTHALAVKRQLSDLEKAHSALESEHKGVQKRLKSAEHRVAQLEAKLEAGKVTTVDQLLRDHVDFLDTCLKECMLTSDKALRVCA